MIDRLLHDWVHFCRNNGDKLFLSNEHLSWTYSELALFIEKAGLELKGEKQSPGVCLINGDYSLETIAWLISGLALGWNMVPVVSETQSVIANRGEISGITHMVSKNTNWRLQECGSTVGNLKGNEKGSGSVILFSSGSMGVPKAMCKSIDLSLGQAGEKRSKSVNMGMLLLFDHIGGLNTLLSGLRKSAHLVSPLSRTPRMMARLIEKHCVKVLPCSPTFLNMMYLDGVFEDFNFKSLRLVTYGTERMPQVLLENLVRALPRTKFMQTFGTSETGIVQTKSLTSSSTFFTIDDPLVDWRIVDQELWLRAEGQISGYLNMEEKAIDDGWFKTGDLVEIRDDKFFKIIGRNKEVINVGGEKVLPTEIEDFVMSDNRVADCTAFSVANGITGQSVGVKVVPRGNEDHSEFKKYIRKICRQQLARYKVPAKIIVSNEIEHTERFKKGKV